MRSRSSRGAALARQVMVGLSLGLATALSGCTVQPPLRVSAADAKQPVNLEKGQELYVALQANRTTGYEWQWTEKPGALVTLLAEPAYEPAPSDGKVGSGGTQTFWFRAQSRGTQKLRFLYRRPSNATERPIDVQAFEIVVH
ncbi:MAG: protease inhibitor I42 family protein [bacterium]